MQMLYTTQHLEGWVSESLSTDELYCKSCSGEGKTWADAELEFCNGACKKKLPEYHFVDAMLVDWQEGDRCWGQLDNGNWLPAWLVLG